MSADLTEQDCLLFWPVSSAIHPRIERLAFHRSRDPDRGGPDEMGASHGSACALDALPPSQSIGNAKPGVGAIRIP
ncbi:hypothetical protein [Burkholderia cepacia]|uniref:hypothetical protein n=1 Tax=Burkholderia cepacia TaxID=292 RepID=UPI0012D95E59|nr:hypothetical protein [Burkholderia cepacia]